MGMVPGPTTNPDTPAVIQQGKWNLISHFLQILEINWSDISLRLKVNAITYIMYKFRAFIRSWSMGDTNCCSIVLLMFNMVCCCSGWMYFQVLIGLRIQCDNGS